MRARFDSSYIRSELEHIGEQLDDPLTVFLIGGGSMAFRGLKDTTKDIDLIVASGDDLGQLQAVLSNLDTRSFGNRTKNTKNSVLSVSSRTMTGVGSTSSTSR